MNSTKITDVYASKTFKEIVKSLKWHGFTAERLTINNSVSVQTFRQWGVSPEKKSFRRPPPWIVDALRDTLIMYDTTLAELLEAALMPAVSPAPVMMYSTPASHRRLWREVFDSGVIPRQELADLAGTDIYSVTWVGREHAKLGIQPEPEAVMYACAMAAEMSIGRVAA